MEINSLIVETTYGKIAGQLVRGYPKEKKNAREWLGVPFASPPQGELRWKAPVDPLQWESIYQANTMPEPCTHYLGFGEAPGLNGSEDCLRMNIYRPDTDESSLPVYFWIHGGANTSGAIREYQGAMTAVKLNAVVVLTQYRLSWLGFMTHPALRDDARIPEDASGNFAYLDMIKALEWVQKNITAFGGNPNLVTVAGESAGAFNAVALLCTEPVKRKNLIHRVISQSGGFTTSHSIEQADERAASLIKTLSANDPNKPDLSNNETVRDYLYSLDAETIAGCVVPDVGMAAPIIDGTVFKKSLDEQIHEGSYHKVPIILGGSRDEYTLMACEMDPYWPLYHAVRGKIKESEIGLSETQLKEYRQFSDQVSLIWRFHIDELADKMSKHQDDVFHYTLRWDGDDDSLYQFVHGAAHAMSIVFFQGDWESGAYITCGFNEGNLPGRQDLSDRIISYEKEFLRSGNPGNGWDREQNHTWKAWQGGSEKYKGITLDADKKEAVFSKRSNRISRKQIDIAFNEIQSAEIQELIRNTVKGLFQDDL